MNKHVGYLILILLSVTTLFGCDNKAKLADTSKNASTVGQQQISLLKGKVTFLLPKALDEQRGVLANQTNNMMLFYNEHSPRKVIVVVDELDKKQNISIFVDALIKQYIDRSSQTRIIKKEELTINNHTVWRFDLSHPLTGQNFYTSFLIIQVDKHLVICQISDLVQQQASLQKFIDQLIKSIEIHA